MGGPWGTEERKGGRATVGRGGGQKWHKKVSPDRTKWAGCLKRNCSSAAVAASLGVEVFCRPGMSGGRKKRWKRKNKGAFPPPSLSFLERCPYFFGRLPLLATYLASDLGGGVEKLEHEKQMAQSRNSLPSV